MKKTLRDVAVAAVGTFVGAVIAGATARAWDEGERWMDRRRRQKKKESK